MTGLVRRLAAEALGTGLLTATVVGAGLMAEGLTSDHAMTLLCNALPVAGMLVVLITVLEPISGAHLNPLVSMAMMLMREMSAAAAAAYAMAQTGGAVVGTITAQTMFGQPLVEASVQVRTGPGLWLGETVASFGLLLVLLLGRRVALNALAPLVGLYLVAAYWFTSSTSFANPAVTVGRMLTNSFAGIRPMDAPAFIVAQVVGALIAIALAGWLGGELPASLNQAHQREKKAVPS